MSSHPMDDTSELDDNEIPTVEIEGFDAENLEELDTLYDGHPLIEILTPAAKIKIILTLLRIQGEKLPPSDIYYRARISHDTWYTYRDELVEKYNVIEKAGTAGNSPLYRINTESEIVELLDQLITVSGERKEEWLIEQRS